MSLSPREQDILALLREEPHLDAAGLAERLGTSKGSVAVALSSLTRKGEILGRTYQLRRHPYAVVVGGAAWDIKARSVDLAVDQTSNPARVSRTPGGVGRNIAEGIARLNNHVHLVAAIGPDSEGSELSAHTAKAGVDMSQIIRSSEPTGSYLAALDHDGELLIGMGDFAATDSLTVPDLLGAKETLARAEIVVIDANLPAEVVDWILLVCAKAEVNVLIEPVSVAKAARIAPLLNQNHPVFVITPNLDELSALVGFEVGPGEADITSAARELHHRGVEHVWVSLGPKGSILISRNGETQSIPAINATVVDVTGAGDSMTAGFVHGLLADLEPIDACHYGHLAASLTVASKYTTRPDLAEAFATALNNSESINGEQS